MVAPAVGTRADNATESATAEITTVRRIVLSFLGFSWRSRFARAGQELRRSGRSWWERERLPWVRRRRTPRPRSACRPWHRNSPRPARSGTPRLPADLPRHSTPRRPVRPRPWPPHCRTDAYWPCPAPSSEAEPQPAADSSNGNQSGASASRSNRVVVSGSKPTPLTDEVDANRAAWSLGRRRWRVGVGTSLVGRRGNRLRRGAARRTDGALAVGRLLLGGNRNSARNPARAGAFARRDDAWAPSHDCWLPYDSAASGCAKRVARTAPLPRSRSFSLRSWSSSRASAWEELPRTLASVGQRARGSVRRSACGTARPSLIGLMAGATFLARAVPAHLRPTRDSAL